MLHDVLLLILLGLLIAGLNGHLLREPLVHLHALFDTRYLLYNGLMYVFGLLHLLHSLLHGMLFGDAGLFLDMRGLLVLGPGFLELLLVGCG